jgi:hypothetical protein
MTRALICPQCNGALSPSRFARSAVCPFCGVMVQLDEEAVSAAVFHEAYRTWNAKPAGAYAELHGAFWSVESQLGGGPHAEIYGARRARWPTERITLKVARSVADQEFFSEWTALEALHASDARGAETFTSLLPQLVSRGEITDGSFSGRPAILFRRAPGFRHSLQAVRAAYPRGIESRASIWLWRRILEVLSFVHASGMAHGAVLPDHLLVQTGEHGIHLIGYRHAGRQGALLPVPDDSAGGFYPTGKSGAWRREPSLDLRMSARCIAHALGGDPADCSVPNSVPAPLADLVRRVGAPESAKPDEDAWALRDELGALAERVYGAPKFCPIVMPGDEMPTVSL